MSNAKSFIIAFCVVYQMSLSSSSSSTLDSVAPKLIEPKANIHQSLNSKLLLLCNVERGSGPLQFEWYYNRDGPLPAAINNNHYRIELAADYSLFIIDKLRATDSGNYSCVARNQFGSDSVASLLLVKGSAGAWEL